MRHAGIKCIYCNRYLMSLDSLNSHQLAVHSNKLKEKRLTRRMKQKPPLPGNVKPVKSILKKANAAKVPGAKLKVLSLPLEKDRSRSKSPQVFSGTDARKVEFSCPKCERLYPTYFSCLRHVQKYHSYNSKGEKVEPDDPELLKPIRTELCLLCNVKVKCSEIHHCSTDSIMKESDASKFVCEVCDRRFTSMKMFEFHVSGLHNNGVQSFFFPTADVFKLWKKDMERDTKCTYKLVGRNRNKHIYRCSHTRNDEETSTLYICPATIIYQEFTKGIQTHFFSVHAGHSFSDYKMKEAYKTHLISDLLQQTKQDTSAQSADQSDSDPYLEFKTIMETIIADAVKVNVSTLRSLTKQALKMTESLFTFSGDSCDEENACRAINTAINTSTPSTDNVETPAKRTRKKNSKYEEKESPFPVKTKSLTIVNSFSLANERDADKILKELDDNDNKKTKLATNLKANKETDDNDKKKTKLSSSLKAKKDSDNNDNINTKLATNLKAKKDSNDNDNIKTKLATNLKAKRESNDNDNIKTKLATNLKAKRESNDNDNIKTKLATNLKAKKDSNDNDNIKTKLTTNLKANKDSKDNDNIKTKLATNLKAIKDSKDNDGIKTKLGTSLLATNGQSPSSFNDSYKDFIDKTLNIKKTPKKKKIVKTKIGQFKPDSPRSIAAKPAKPEARISQGSTKDFVYEVQERDDDCNILILKI